MMKHRKVITGEQKRAIIEEYLATDRSSRDIAAHYGISQASVLNWSKPFNESTMAKKQTSNNNEGLEDQSNDGNLDKDITISLLEKELKNLRLKNELLERVIEKANKHYKTDLKKIPARSDQ